MEDYQEGSSSQNFDSDVEDESATGGDTSRSGK